MLVLPCQDDSVTYQLKGIVYVGGQHFSTRLITDGPTNAGRPQLETVANLAIGNGKLPSHAEVDATTPRCSHHR